MPILSPTAAERVYSRLEPIAHGDEDTGYMLYGLVEALTLPQEALDEIVREDDTHPAWTRAVDPYEAPLWVLPWLAGLVGVEWSAPSSELLRTKVLARPNYRRGTVPAIISSTQVTLTGTKTVYVLERRSGSPWQMTVGTLEAETPDPAWTLREILAEKPAGVILENVIIDLAAWTYLALTASHTDYTDATASFATYWDMFLGP